MLCSDTAQSDPDTLVKIEKEEPDAVPIPVWLQFIEVAAAALLNEFE
jgi:hypothetical protein